MLIFFTYIDRKLGSNEVCNQTSTVVLRAGVNEVSILIISTANHDLTVTCIISNTDICRGCREKLSGLVACFQYNFLNLVI